MKNLGMYLQRDLRNYIKLHYRAKESLMYLQVIFPLLYVHILFGFSEVCNETAGGAFIFYTQSKFTMIVQ